jgi:hypothetical protein
MTLKRLLEDKPERVRSDVTPGMLDDGVDLGK